MEPFLLTTQRRRKARSFRIKLYLSIAGCLFFVLGFISFVRFIPLFHIRNISVAGAEGSDANTIRDTVTAAVLARFTSFLYGQDNYFAWPENISSPSAKFSSIEIHKSLFKQTAEIIAVPREHFLVWCTTTNKGCVWVDKAGIAYEETGASEGQIIWTVYDDDPLPKVGDTVLPTTQFGFLTEMINFMPELTAVQKLHIDRGVQELVVETTAGAEIRLSLRFDPQENLFGIQNLLKTTSLSKLLLIDATVPDKIYTKEK